MTNQTVINAIALALEPLQATVYVTEAKQDIRDGDIIVMATGTMSSRLTAWRYSVGYSFDVIYLSEDKEKALAVADDLFELLEEINTDDGRIRGSGFSYHWADGALHFLVTYQVLLTRVQEQGPMMKRLTINGGIKNG